MSGDWVEQMAAEQAGGPAPDPEPAELGEDVFANVGEFVEQYLAQLYRRDVAGLKSLRWCPEWWKHAEGIARLHAMWRAWEMLRQDPGAGMSDWFLGHCDPHMRVLLSEEGPFRHCRKGHADEARLEPLRFTTPAEKGEDRFWDPPSAS